MELNQKVHLNPITIDIKQIMKNKVYFFCTLLITYSCINYDDEIENLQNEIIQLKEIQNLLQLKNILYENIFSETIITEIEENSTGGDVSQIWQYGKDRGEEMFAPFISDIDYFEESTSVFITAGSTAFDLDYSNLNSTITNNINQDETLIIEVNKQNQVLFEMSISSSNAGSTYRSEKLVIK